MMSTWQIVGIALAVIAVVSAYQFGLMQGRRQGFEDGKKEGRKEGEREGTKRGLAVGYDRGKRARAGEEEKGKRPGCGLMVLLLVLTTLCWLLQSRS
jgi:hypothetical protein